MICETIPFRAEHLDLINEQDAEIMFGEFATQGRAEALERIGSRTIMVHGRPVLCGGIVEYWNGRCEIWAVLDRDCRKEFVAIHRATKEFLDTCTHRRIEAVVIADFAEGRRWVEMLGFKLETPAAMRGYCPNGADAYLYARVA